MVLYSFGLAAFIFHVLPSEAAGPIIRRAFPLFYLFVIISSVIPAILIFSFDKIGAGILLVIATTTLPTRQLLMPAINRATDRGDKSSFKLLHSLSVAVTLTHIVLSAWVLLRFIQG